MPDWLIARFSWEGLIAVVLQQIPGVIWALRSPPDDPFARNSGSLSVEILEKTFGIGTIILLVLVVAATGPFALSRAFLAGGYALLAVYYGLYVAYYRGVTRLPVLLGMAVCPPLCFALIAAYQGNLPALGTSVLFGVVHIGLTYANFAPRR